jgi:5-methyltetrahydropteroyltriglutamate--homocysteine methyltransferase
MTRIKTIHGGSLPPPPALLALVVARETGKPHDEHQLDAQLTSAVAEVVRKQVEIGLDSINDGEFGKSNFNNYMRDRLAGFEERPEIDGPSMSISDRDRAGGYAGYFERGGLASIGVQARRFFCVDQLSYKGQALVQRDIANFKAALAAVQDLPHASEVEPFLPAVAPGTIEHWLNNDHYADDESFLYAIADVMREEYKAIVDAGFLLQIDDPDLADAWQLHSEMDVPAYRRFAEMRIDALNHALRDIPRDRVRFHMCWGSYHGPHEFDIPLKDIVDIVLKVKAQSYSIEASNPVHEHEWAVWRDTKLPEGTTLTPGVVGHFSDFIENPELVAQRLVRYAGLVGSDQLMAGTDCGIGTRIGHPDIAWAKYATLVEGARRASERL